MTTSAIELTPLASADVAAIHGWPPYPARVEALDYALRPGGWLDMFPASTTNRRFAIRSGGALVGFTLLVDIDGEEAEFYIAIHPAQLGRGLGRAATQQTAAFGFRELGLARIHLKVRVWHEGAARLYREVGFVLAGAKTLDVLGQPTAFLWMTLSRDAFGC
jgi:RimJ/RimL family protein N-acetyltransferase